MLQRSLREKGVEKLTSEGRLKKVSNKGIFLHLLFTMHPSFNSLFHIMASSEIQESVFGEVKGLLIAAEILPPFNPLAHPPGINISPFSLTCLLMAPTSSFKQRMGKWLDDFYLSGSFQGPKESCKLKECKNNWALGISPKKCLLKLWFLGRLGSSVD